MTRSAPGAAELTRGPSAATDARVNSVADPAQASGPARPELPCASRRESGEAQAEGRDESCCIALEERASQPVPGLKRTPEPDRSPPDRAAAITSATSRSSPRHPLRLPEEVVHALDPRLGTVLPVDVTEAVRPEDSAARPLNVRDQRGVDPMGQRPPSAEGLEVASRSSGFPRRYGSSSRPCPRSAEREVELLEVNELRPSTTSSAPEYSAADTRSQRCSGPYQSSSSILVISSPDAASVPALSASPSVAVELTRTTVNGPSTSCSRPSSAWEGNRSPCSTITSPGADSSGG